jgi:hypothetical protein
MSDTITSNLKLVDQANGGNSNTWGDIADTNFAIIERAITQSQSLDLAGGNVTLTDTQNRAAILILTGSIGANREVVVQAAEKMWLVFNNTTGSFSVTVKTAAGSGVVVPQGQRLWLRSDGTNVVDVALSLPLTDGSVTTAKLADGAVTSSKLGNNAATATKQGWHADASLVSSPNHAIDKSLFWDQGNSQYKQVVLGRIGAGVQTLNIAARACVARTTNGATTFDAEQGANRVMISGYSFDAATQQYIQAKIFLPKGIDTSAGFRFRFYWRQATAEGAAGTSVIWQARAQYVGDGQVFDGAWGTPVDVQDAYIGSGQLMLTPTSSAMTPAGTHTENCAMVVEFSRKASDVLDDYSQAAVLVGVAVFYTTLANTDT